MKQPKVFISYCQKKAETAALVEAIYRRLREEEAVDAMLDKYDMAPGHDVFVYMEKVVNDPGVQFCLIMCDEEYARRAQDRLGGVGVEASIITPKVYGSASQSKFIPIILDVDREGKPFVPTFLIGRIYIDFSSTEKMARNWSELISLLHGQPVNSRPPLADKPRSLGSKPSGGLDVIPGGVQQRQGERGLIAGDNLYASAGDILANLLDSVVNGKPSANYMRAKFVEAVYKEVLAIPIKKYPDSTPEDVLRHRFSSWFDLLREQAAYRDMIVEWVHTESLCNPDDFVRKTVRPLVDGAVLAKSALRRANELERFDAFGSLVHELALFYAAISFKNDSAKSFRELMEIKYVDSLRPGCPLHDFQDLYHVSTRAINWNKTLDPGWLCPIGEVIHIMPQNRFYTFNELVEADAACFLVSVIEGKKWYPVLAAYSEDIGLFPWFAKAHRQRNPDRLAIVTGLDSLRSVNHAVIATVVPFMQTANYSVFRYIGHDYLEKMGFSGLPGQ